MNANINATAARISPTATAQIASFFKVTSRVGVAHTTVHPDGNLTYTNRRGQIFGLSVEGFEALYAAGYSVPNARVAVEHATVEAIEAALVEGEAYSVSLVKV